MTFHILIQCLYVRAFWPKIEEFILQNLSLNSTLDFEPQNIIFNMVHTNKSNLSNMIVLLAKQHIYRTRCRKTRPIADIVIDTLYKIYSYKHYYAKQNCKITKHTNKWATSGTKRYTFEASCQVLTSIYTTRLTPCYSLLFVYC